MGKYQRRKGHDAEREVVRIAKGQGLEARRSWASQSPDVTIDGQKVSVKRRAKKEV
jgi:Holliday junction resolvase